MSIHKSTPHDAAKLHVTGAARYTDDIPTPANCLHLAFGLSDVAHGTITSVDLTAVRAADGVIDVLLAADLPAGNDVSPSNHDEPMLADGTVHFVGQPVFLVVATSHLAARKAAALGTVKISPLPAILSIDDAIKADTKFEPPIIFAKGDASDAIKNAEHTLSGSFEMGGQEHFYLEGQAALSVPNEGDMLVHSSTQHPTEIQHKVAEALGASHSTQFASKFDVWVADLVAKKAKATPWLSRVPSALKTGRPCKMRYDRDDDMIITGKRHDFRMDYTVGYNGAGFIEGIEFTQYCRCGWAQDLSLPVADRAMLHSDNAYFLPNAKITSHRLKTNTVSATAFRGFGGPQGVLAIERVIDHIAHTMDVDASYIRTANAYANKSRGLKQTTPYHMEVTDSVTDQIMIELLEKSDYSKRRELVKWFNHENPHLKRGIAFSPVKFGISFTLTHLNQAGALVHVYQDGSSWPCEFGKWAKACSPISEGARRSCTPQATQQGLVVASATARRSSWRNREAARTTGGTSML